MKPCRFKNVCSLASDLFMCNHEESARESCQAYQLLKLKEETADPYKIERINRLFETGFSISYAKRGR